MHGRETSVSDMLDNEGNQYDVAIVGGGLSGLSIACWLLDLATDRDQPMPSICILEPRTEYENDRTWCFWQGVPNTFDSLVARRWSRWQVGFDGKYITQSSNQHAYAMLEAHDVYQYAQDRISACSNTSLKLGIEVSELIDNPGAVEIITNHGRLRARVAIDSRPPGLDQMAAHKGFWQRFSGHEVYCPGHGLEIETTTLMDFQACDDHVRFVYALPFDKERCLIEWTEFDPSEGGSDCSSKAMGWLRAQNWGKHEVLRTESGSLPMFPLHPRTQSPRLVNAGIGAGWMRPATGYQFATCQRVSKILAEQLLAAKKHGIWHLQQPKPRPDWLNWMDIIFLRALRRHPATAPRWFLSMFSGANAEQMVRFMNDEPRLSDALAIARTLPKTTFLKAAFSV
jgi:lycopene beta-cyclase